MQMNLRLRAENRSAPLTDDGNWRHSHAFIQSRPELQARCGFYFFQVHLRQRREVGLQETREVSLWASRLQTDAAKKNTSSGKHVEKTGQRSQLGSAGSLGSDNKDKKQIFKVNKLVRKWSRCRNESKNWLLVINWEDLRLKRQETGSFPNQTGTVSFFFFFFFSNRFNRTSFCYSCKTAGE